VTYSNFTLYEIPCSGTELLHAVGHTRQPEMTNPTVPFPSSGDAPKMLAVLSNRRWITVLSSPA